jgi:hypothetical protein
MVQSCHLCQYVKTKFSIGNSVRTYVTDIVNKPPPVVRLCMNSCTEPSIVQQQKEKNEKQRRKLDTSSYQGLRLMCC